VFNLMRVKVFERQGRRILRFLRFKIDILAFVNTIVIRRGWLFKIGLCYFIGMNFKGRKIIFLVTVVLLHFRPFETGENFYPTSLFYNN